MRRPDKDEWEKARQKEADGFDGPNLPKKKIIRIRASSLPESMI